MEAQFHSLVIWAHLGLGKMDFVFFRPYMEMYLMYLP